MDWLNFLVSVDKRVKVIVPEWGYASLRTLADVVLYVDFHTMQRN